MSTSKGRSKGRGKKPSTPPRHENIWAPWRMEYINGLADGDDGCFLCRCRDDRKNDAANLVLWRGRKNFIVLNRFPYTGGHSMVAPLEHLADLTDLDDATMLEMLQMIRDLQRVLSQTVHAHGFNIGINLGRCAGAGLPDHLHVHVVPRWAGDTNFMPVLTGKTVIPVALEKLFAQLRQTAGQLRLPWQMT
ncbi:MAG: HIT domain-containing protein [Phycisphaerae bacterium]